jgi:hypothetical protein
MAWKQTIWSLEVRDRLQLSFNFRTAIRDGVFLGGGAFRGCRQHDAKCLPLCEVECVSGYGMKVLLEGCTLS